MRFERSGSWSRIGLGAVVIGIYCLLWLAFSRYPGVFFSGDQGLKFLQIQSLARGHLGIGYPGQEVDPDYKYFPIVSRFITRIKGEVTTVYLNLFVYWAALFYRVGGWTGLYFLPCLISLLILFLSFRLSSFLTASSSFGVVILLGFCSPLLLSSLILQEHALVGLLILTAIAILWNKGELRLSAPRAVSSGILIGLSVLVRQEAIVAAAAWLISLGWIGRRSRGVKVTVVFSLLGIGAVIAIYLLSELAIYGSIIEPNIYLALKTQEGAGVVRWLRLRAYYLGQLGFGLVDMVGINHWPYLCLPSCLLLVSRFFPPFRRSHAFTGAALILWIISLLLVWAAIIFRGAWVCGVIYTTPYVLLLAFFPRQLSQSPLIRFIILFCALYVLFLLLFTTSEGGLQWGPRYLLPLYPELGLAAGFCIGRLPEIQPPRLRRYSRLLAIFLAAFSFMLQGEGMARLYQKKAAREVIRLIDEADTDTWITYLFYFPQEAAARYYDRKFFYFSPSRQSLLNLLIALRRSDQRDFALAGDRYQIKANVVPFIEANSAFRPSEPGRSFRIYDFDLWAVLFRTEEAIPAGGTVR